MKNERLKQFCQSTTQEWYALMPWEKLQKLNQAYLDAQQITIPTPKTLQKTEQEYKKLKGQKLDFLTFLQKLQNITKKFPEDNITPCLFMFAANSVFQWLNQKRKTPIDQKHLRILTGYINHIVQNQIEVEPYADEIINIWTVENYPEIIQNPNIKILKPIQNLPTKIYKHPPKNSLVKKPIHQLVEEFHHSLIGQN